MVSLKGDGHVKFDFVIGNPPYQDESQRNNGYAAPVYHAFMDASNTVGDVVELIHPARFLFNAGSTPKAWNEKMLSDPHFKVLNYVPDSSSYFPTVEIKGGIAITYRNANKNFGAIEVFTSHHELNSILKKVRSFNIQPVSDVAYVTAKFNFQTLFSDYPECSEKLKERRLATNVLEILNGIVFHDTPDAGIDSIRVYGRIGNERVYRWIARKYIDLPNNIDKYKLFLPKVSGNGTFGETITEPVLGFPAELNTHTFMSLGSLNTEYEGIAFLKYIKCKFTRTMLGVLKITQHNSNECWRYVPLQNFTPTPDIDWSQPIPAIDQQLYRKYDLTDEEIAFIESHVKEMT